MTTGLCVTRFDEHTQSDVSILRTETPLRTLKRPEGRAPFAAHDSTSVFGFKVTDKSSNCGNRSSQKIKAPLPILHQRFGAIAFSSNWGWQIWTGDKSPASN
jgi:hypothetical protein